MLPRLDHPATEETIAVHRFDADLGILGPTALPSAGSGAAARAVPA
jgi:hypothetical protein